MHNEHRPGTPTHSGRHAHSLAAHKDTRRHTKKLKDRSTFKYRDTRIQRYTLIRTRKRHTGRDTFEYTDILKYRDIFKYRDTLNRDTIITEIHVQRHTQIQTQSETQQRQSDRHIQVPKDTQVEMYS